MFSLTYVWTNVRRNYLVDCFSLVALSVIDALLVIIFISSILN